jgi:Gluconate 2-dehydrogenase subunit 3
VAVNGEESVRDLETADPQSVARAGLAALRDLSRQAHGQEFLQLTPVQQIDLLTSADTAQSGNLLRKFFEIARAQAIRGYYTSAAGLEELDYKGNAYYGDSPGCEAKS